jgi:hypothetical protein
MPMVCMLRGLFRVNITNHSTKPGHETMKNGLILFEGKSLIGDRNIAAIVTFEMANIKTGEMVQVWIIDQELNPLEALQNNVNESTCGKCRLQGEAYKYTFTRGPRKGKTITKIENRVCYVNRGQAPMSIWKAYKRGKYVNYDKHLHRSFFKGRKIRWGADGDPAALPIPLMRSINKLCAGHTGYSHQLFWIDKRRAEKLATFLMCSCHTPAQHAEARRRGWRSFVAVADGQKLPADCIACPNMSKAKTQCIDCTLCRGGQNGKARDVYILSHAKVGLNLSAVQKQQGAKLN